MRLFCLGIYIFCLQVFAAEETVIQIRAYNRITSAPAIYLSELVDVQSIKDFSILKQLQNVVLGDAPALGEKRIYSNKAIAEAVRRNVKNKNWNIRIPHRVIVENRGYEI